MYEIKINIAADNAVGDPLYMEDWGLKIQLEGLTLPTAYEVHFSNNPASPAKMAVGDSSGVIVPYEFTAKSGTLYGWLVFTNTTSGYTKRAFTIPIIRRSPLDPPEVLPEQVTAIDVAIAALNTAIEVTNASAEAAAASAEESANSATESAASATEAAASVEQAAEKVNEAQEAADASTTSATAASQSAATAQAAATRAEYAMNAARTSATEADESATLAQTAVDESATNAQAAADSAEQAIASQAQAATDATRANTYATRAQASATTASNAATSASNSAGAALNHANNAATSATAAQTAQSAAESAATTATGKATEAEASAQNAANSATAAEAAATEAGQIVDDATAWALGAYATSSASGAVATVDDGAEGVPVKALTAYIVPVQDGTGDPSPDNVRPISGWTGMNLTRTGKNLFHFIDMSATASGTYKTASVANELIHVIASRSVGSRVLVSVDAFSAAISGRKLPDGVYTFSVGDFDSNISGLAKKNIQLTLTDGTTVLEGGSFTVTSENQPVSIGYASQISFVAGAYVDFNLQCETGTTKNAYEPYIGTTYPVTWQDTAGTVYGGQYDAVTGKLTVTHRKGVINGTTETVTGAWGATANGYVVFKTVAGSKRSASAWCDKFAYTEKPQNEMPLYSWRGNSSASTTWSFVLPSTITSIEEANAWFAENQTEFICELTNPVEYQLSPLEIETLKGINNFFADTGDTDVIVRADPDLHLSKLIAQAVAVALENA